MVNVARRVFGIVVLLVALAAVQPSRAALAKQASVAPPNPLGGGVSNCGPDLPHQNSDAVYRICRPPFWWPIRNDDLVIWAHGYVAFNEPVAIPEGQLCPFEGLCINEIVNALGYDFATTSYAVNGLAVLPGLADVAELVDLYTAQYGPPEHVYLIGASEGGLITTLATEQRADVFDGGLAVCGPVGDFERQVQYLGDFRVVLDYFFPGLLPGDPTYIPPELIENWDAYYDDVIRPVLADPANWDRLRQVVAVTDAPYLPDDPATLEESLYDLLWYNVFATNNANEVLGGQPFDNQRRWYRGSDNDIALNAGVQRVSADPAALAEIEANYQTSGQPEVPLVTIHTVLDQQVPYWHERLYKEKTIASGAYGVTHVNYPPTQGYGHCAVDVVDLLDAFDLIVSQSGGERSAHFDTLRRALSTLSEADRTVSLDPR